MRLPGNSGTAIGRSRPGLWKRRFLYCVFVAENVANWQFLISEIIFGRVRNDLVRRLNFTNILIVPEKGPSLSRMELNATATMIVLDLPNAVCDYPYRRRYALMKVTQLFCRSSTTRLNPVLPEQFITLRNEFHV